jgi:DNA-binding IclR family transcriptional regulator
MLDLDDLSSTAPPVAGAQVVSRIALLLRLVGRDPGGSSLVDIVRDSGLTRPTVYRLLNSLAAEGLLAIDPVSRTWRYGPEIFVMGTVAAPRYPIEELARPALQRLADASGESAFLSIRRGLETVCLMGEEGRFPVRSFVLHEGVRFPLGVASAGLAILSALPDSEVEQVLTAQAGLTERWGAQNAAAAIRLSVQATRERGCALNPGLVLEGSWGMGAVVFDRSGQPAWALSLTGIEPRFRTDRQGFLGDLLRTEAALLTRRLAEV